MGKEAANFEVRTTPEGVIWLAGELDLAAEGQFRRLVADAVTGQREVMLDLSELTFLDSSGLRAILTFAADCRVGVVLRHPRHNVREVIRIAGVEGEQGIRIE